MAMSVAVLSLWLIIASSAVRYETTPDRRGGLKTVLLNDHTLSSRSSIVVLSALLTPGPSI